MKQARLDEGNIHGSNLRSQRPPLHIAFVNKELCRSNELESEGLMPSCTPPASYTPIKGLRERPEDVGVLPELSTHGIHIAHNIVLEQIVHTEDGVDGCVNTHQTNELTVCLEKPRRKLLEKQWQCEISVRAVGAVWILDHEDGTKVQDECEKNDSAKTCPYELLFGQVAIVATFRHDGHVLEGNGVSIANVGWNLGSGNRRDTAVPTCRELLATEDLCQVNTYRLL